MEGYFCKVMNVIGTIKSYDDVKKVGDIILTIRDDAPIILKDIKDLRRTLGGGCEITSPLAKGDIVLLTSVITPTNIKGEKLHYTQISGANDYVITGVFETKKNIEATLKYEDANNKIEIEGSGQASIKIGELDLFETLKSMTKLTGELLEVISGLTATQPVLPSGTAVGTADIQVLNARLTPITTKLKKIESTIIAVEKK